MAKWKADGGASAKPLCDRMEEAKRPQPDGISMGFELFEADVLTKTLAGMLTFSTQVPELEHSGMAFKACARAGKRGAITPDALVAALSEIEAEYLQRPHANYHLATHVSLPRGLITSSLKVHGATLTFPNALAKQEKETIEDCLHSSEELSTKDIPRQYQVVRIDMAGRTENEAGNAALDGLDLLRAAWNLHINERTSLRHSSGNDPVNRITLGPIQALFDASGKPTLNWWYEPTYRKPHVWRDAQANMQKMERFRRAVFRWLRRSHYGDELAACLLRYVRALDLRDWHSAFLRLWGIMESLTAATDSPKLVVRRGVSLYREREIAMLELNVFRDLRNRHAHAGHLMHNPEHGMYRVKKIVEILLMFHLSNSFGFRSMGEAGEFLDLPSSIDDLKRRGRMSRYAIKIRTPKPKRAPAAPTAQP